VDPDSLEQVVSVVFEERRVAYHVYLLRIDLALLIRSISKEEYAYRNQADGLRVHGSTPWFES
jgi:hypothetical protein